MQLDLGGEGCFYAFAPDTIDSRGIAADSGGICRQLSGLHDSELKQIVIAVKIG
jgi:hypothetical protein